VPSTSTRPPPAPAPPASSSRDVVSGPRRRRSDDSSRDVDPVAQLTRELERAKKVAAAFRDVGLALGAARDLDALLDLVLARIVSTLEADRATLYLLDRERNTLVSRLVQGGEVRQIQLAVGEGIAGAVAETGEIVLVRDAYKDARFNPEWDLTSGYRTRSILCVPMRDTSGRTSGVVQVLNKKQGVFTADDAGLLTALATSAGIAVENAVLLASLESNNAALLATKEELEHRVRDLRLLFDLERAMGRVTSLEELFVSVLKEAVKTSGARAGAIALRHGPTDEMQLYVLPHNARKTRHVPWTRGNGFLGDVVARGVVVLTNDARSDPRFDGEAEDLIGKGEPCVLAVPIEGEGDAETPMGAIALFGKPDGGRFVDADRTLMLLLAANASTSIRLQLAREGREREERLTTIGRLLAGVMHDLKTPLGVLSGYLQLMVQADDRVQREEFGELAHKQFGLISAMQREVLEFARGERSMLVRKVYLQPFFEDISRQIEGVLARAGVELTVELADRGVARFDEGKLTRLVHNLARNAAEAMAAQGGGKFTIAVSRADDGALVLTFTDTGPGIPKEIRHRLFQSFVTSGKKGGTGLGLAIAKKIAEEHGGTIEALPTAAGQPSGAVFRLTIPQATQAAP
jgi:signal transduction histidine kinase/putative methionine-R-sulfoxide reductase with GAF domain